MKFHSLLFAALALFPGAVGAQFTDAFSTLDPAWVPNRYNPAGFESVTFDGDTRLRVTFAVADSAANRAPAYSSAFYDIQGRDRAGGITGLWTISAQVYVAAAFNTSTGPLASSSIWGHTGTTPGGGDYLELGFTNASPVEANALNPAAGDREFRFRAFDPGTSSWIDLGVPGGFAFNAWHTLSGTSTGTTFEYRLDGVLLHTKATAAGSDLLSVMIQGYNYGDSTYSVHWDNVSASAIPEPATSALGAALVALGVAAWRRRRARPPGFTSPTSSPLSHP